MHFADLSKSPVHITEANADARETTVAELIEHVRADANLDICWCVDEDAFDISWVRRHELEPIWWMDNYITITDTNATSEQRVAQHRRFLAEPPPAPTGRETLDQVVRDLTRDVIADLAAAYNAPTYRCRLARSLLAGATRWSTPREKVGPTGQLPGVWARPPH